jgi:hypothetical protein
MLDDREALGELIDNLNRIPEIQESREKKPSGYRKAIEIIVSIAEGGSLTIDQIEECLGYEVA